MTTFGVLPSSPSSLSSAVSCSTPVAFVSLALGGKPLPLLSPFFLTLTLNRPSSVSLISGIVVLGTEGDVVLGIKAVVVSVIVVPSITVMAVVGAAEDVVLLGAQVDEAGRVVGLLLGGMMRRYLGGGPGFLRRLEFGQLCRPHSDLERGLVDRSHVFFGASAHVTVRERTPPPHVTGHCVKKNMTR